MSGEIKILFYIIVGIVYLISTFYGKEKKKQGERNLSKKPVDINTAEDIFRELKKSIMEPESIEPNKEVQAKIPYKKMERKPEISVNFDKFMKSKKKPQENTFVKESHIEHIVVENASVSETEELMSEINLEDISPRKAFIYGEIFRRPQY